MNASVLIMHIIIQGEIQFLEVAMNQHLQADEFEVCQVFAYLFKTKNIFASLWICDIIILYAGSCRSRDRNIKTS